MIKPYLSNVVNDYKTQGKWKVHLDSTIINYKSQGEWKIQLTVAIIFMSSNDSDETRTMHPKAITQKLWQVMKQMKLLENFLILFLQRYDEGLVESIEGK